MNRYYFERALTPAGWSDGVRIDVDEEGAIHAVTSDADPLDARSIAGIALPGMPNLHSHAHQRAIAGLSERGGPSGDSFWTWRDIMYRFAALLTPESLEAIAAQLYSEMLVAGFTHVCEFHYVHHQASGAPYDNRAEMALRTMAAARRVGIGMTIVPVLYKYGGFGGAAPAEGQKRFLNDADGFLSIVEALNQAAAPGEVVGMAPHSLRAVDEALLADVLDGFKRTNPTGPIHIHVAEQRKEVDDCVAWSGLRPVEWLDVHFRVDTRWCVIHATHMTPEETYRLAQTGAVAGICPATEGNLGDGLFNAKDYLQANGRFGIGSDSNVSVSVVEELRWLEYGQRLRHHERNLFADSPGQSTARALYDGALQGGAQASGLALGALDVGARADFITLRKDHPLLYGKSGDSVLDAWLFSGNANLVDTVAVAGRVVVEDGVHLMQEGVSASFRRTMDGLGREI